MCKVFLGEIAPTICLRFFACNLLLGGFMISLQLESFAYPLRHIIGSPDSSDENKASAVFACNFSSIVFMILLQLEIFDFSSRHVKNLGLLIHPMKIRHQLWDW